MRCSHAAAPVCALRPVAHRPDDGGPLTGITPEAWRRALARLIELEREAAALRLNSTDGSPQTVTQIARALEIGRERVRRIEAKVLARLEQILPDEE